jgi:hypothetical protein
MKIRDCEFSSQLRRYSEHRVASNKGDRNFPDKMSETFDDYSKTDRMCRTWNGEHSHHR